MAEKSPASAVNLDTPDILKMFDPVHVVKPENPILEELDLKFESNGRVDTLRTSVLSFLASGRYEVAARELRIYQTLKSEQTAYKKATDSLFRHAIEMIAVMKTLTENKDLASLPRAKRQDSLMRVRRLFENMKQVLKRLEQIENDLSVLDARSVVWFLQSSSISIFFIIAVAAFTEAVTTLGRSLEVFSISSADWLFHLLKM